MKHKYSLSVDIFDDGVDDIFYTPDELATEIQRVLKGDLNLRIENFGLKERNN